MAKAPPPQFPEVDPETLTQSILTSLAARMNVSALQAGAAPNYAEVIRGWAEGIAAAQNPSNSYFQQNDDALFSLLQQGVGGDSGSLLFTAAVPLLVGQWVYQVSADTVGLADFSSPSTGPVVGVVVGIPSESTVLVQNLGSYLYTAQQSFQFLPLVPDTIYYLGSSGSITSVASPPPGGFLQKVGYAKNTLQFVLNIQDPTAA